MNEDSSEAIKQRAPRLRISPIWLVPLGAALIGGWLLFQSIISQGEVITLVLPTAEGLEAGKTAVKLRNVDVGKVESVRLSDDYSQTIASVRMGPDMTPLLVEDTKFWVVKPRIGRQGVSGLSTIVSGAYIQMHPGTSDTRKEHYEVLEQPLAVKPDVPGLSLTLTTDEDRSLSAGDPIVYQGHTVGQIQTVSFDVEQRRTRYQAFIESPYDQLISRNTQFWSRSGVDFQITSEGLQLSLGNIQSILAGGVTFGVLGNMAAGHLAEDGAEYTLYASRAAASDDRFDREIPYIVLFRDSLRGLHKGASVEFRGIRVGTVAEAPYYSGNGHALRMDQDSIPVLIHLEPERLSASWAEMSDTEWRAELRKQFDRGLRASLNTASLITGALYVGLDFAKGTRYTPEEDVAGYPVFPSESGGLAGIEQKVARLLDKINALEVNPVLQEIPETLARTRALMRGVEASVKELNSLLDSPGTRQLPTEMNATLRQLQETLNGFQPGQPPYQSLERSLQRLERIMEDVAPLAQTLREQPNAILLGKDPESDPEPKAAP